MTYPDKARLDWWSPPSTEFPYGVVLITGTKPFVRFVARPSCFIAAVNASLLLQGKKARAAKV